MKADREKYPDLPEGCSLNFDARTGKYLVFRDFWEPDPETGRSRRVRVTYGHIKDGAYEKNVRYEMELRIRELEAEVAELRKANRRPSSPDRAEQEDPARGGAAAASVAKVAGRIGQAVEASGVEARQGKRTAVDMSVLAAGALLSGLTGATDCVEIADFINRNKGFLSQFGRLPENGVSHDTVRKCLMLAKRDRFGDFYTDMVSGLVGKRAFRVVAADGQANRATGASSPDRPELHGAWMEMNVYDVDSRVCVVQKLIGRKRSEVSVGPAALSGIDIRGAIVTADAMNCQVRFAQAVSDGGGHYMLAVKGNQETLHCDARAAYNLTHPDQIAKYTADVELDHGRIERRAVEIVRGALVSKRFRDLWPGLAGGCVIRATSRSERKATGRARQDERFYISSLPPDNPETLLGAIRSHWEVENSLHWKLDMYFSQDQMQARDGSYVLNRCALNKMSLAFLENYGRALVASGREAEPVSTHILMQRCRDLATAVECLSCGMGYGLLPDVKPLRTVTPRPGSRCGASVKKD